MAITAAQVKELREMTGAGMMDCKKALTETDGDKDKAVEYLREKGLATAAKKSGRIAAEGIVKAYVDGNVGVLVEVTQKQTSLLRMMNSNSLFQTLPRQSLSKILLTLKHLKN